MKICTNEYTRAQRSCKVFSLQISKGIAIIVSINNIILLQNDQINDIYLCVFQYVHHQMDLHQLQKIRIAPSEVSKL